MCSSAVLCRGPAMLLPRGCRGHATGKRKGGLEGGKAEGGQRGNTSFNKSISFQTCASHHVWTHCLNPLFEPNVCIGIQHRFGKPCSHFGNPTSTWQIMFPCWTSNIDSENHVPFWKSQRIYLESHVPILESHVPILETEHRFQHPCSHLDTQHRFGCECSHVGHPTACCIL